MPWKTAASAGLGAAGHRTGLDVRRDSVQKTARDTQKDSSACLLDAHGRCRRVNRREPIRMTLHAAARLPSYRPRPIHGSLRHSRNRTTGRFQTHETLKTMTTIIMRTSDDNSPWSFLALFQGFRFLGNLTITLVFHEAPTDTQE